MFKNRLFFFLSVTSALGLLSCVSVPPSAEPTQSAQPVPVTRKTLLRSEPQEKPVWVDTIPKSDTELFFVGTSLMLDTVAQSRDAARENAFTQIVKYYGQYIKATGIERSSLSGSSDEILTPYIEREDEITRFAETIVSQVGANNYYTEVYINAKNKEEYIVYVLCQISRNRAERDIDNFARNISERYGNLIRTQSTLVTALTVYADTANALRNNPLHRAVAFYDSPGGSVGLYDYCTAQISAIANSVSFAPVLQSSVQKGESFNTTVRLASSLFKNLGAPRCRVTIAGNNNTAPSALYTVGQDSSFSLVIHTEKLETGKYNVQLELLLSETTSAVRQNPSLGFSLEVTPGTAVVEITGANLSETEKSTLIQGVQQGLQNNAVTLQIVPQKAQSTFSIILNIKTQPPSPPLNTVLVLCDVSIAFKRNGTVIIQSETKHITETNTARAAALAAGFIRDNANFFLGVKDAVTR
jgi:hypothetical protein